MQRLVFKTEDPIKHWITLLSGHKRFTDREIDVLAIITKKQAGLMHKLTEEYLSPVLLSPTARKEYCNELGITSQNFNNILSTLKSKGVFKKTKAGDIVDELYIPRQRFEIIYEVRRKDIQEASDETQSI
jgi:hypothetical protein